LNKKSIISRERESIVKSGGIKKPPKKMVNKELESKTFDQIKN